MEPVNGTSPSPLNDAVTGSVVKIVCMSATFSFLLFELRNGKMKIKVLYMYYSTHDHLSHKMRGLRDLLFYS